MKDFKMKTGNKAPQKVENMRAKDVAIFMGCGLSTVWLWVKQGKIKAYRISDRITIFKRSELEAFIDASVEEGLK